MGRGNGSIPAVSQVFGRGNVLTITTVLTTLVFQAKKAPSQDASLVKELELLEKAIEGRQFVAHANSILETEATTEKVSIY